MGIILVLVFVIFFSFGRLQFIKQSRVMIRLRWMNGLEHNYRLSFGLVEQKKYRDLETNVFPINVEPMLI